MIYEHWWVVIVIEECSKYLEDKGYRLIQEYADTLAIVDVSQQNHIFKALSGSLHRKTLC